MSSAFLAWIKKRNLGLREFYGKNLGEKRGAAHFFQEEGPLPVWRITFHNVNMKVVPMCWKSERESAQEHLYEGGENGRGSMLEEKELWRVWEECTCAVSVHAILTVSRDMHLTIALDLSCRDSQRKDQT